MTLDVGVDMGVDVSNINRLRQDKDIYINLYNKYKARIESESAYQKHKIISECKNCKEYALLNMEEQEKLFLALMIIDKRIKK